MKVLFRSKSLQDVVNPTYSGLSPTKLLQIRLKVTGQSYSWRQLYVQSFPSILAPDILLASDSELRPRRSSGVRLAYTDPSGVR